MPNSDNAFGTFNKITKVLYLKEYKDGQSTASNVEQNFGGNVETAKSYFLTDEALACINDNGTNVQYAITADGNGLKWTIDFGLPNNNEADSWAKKYKDTKTTLVNNNQWVKQEIQQNMDGSSVADWTSPWSDSTVNTYWSVEDDSSHLF
tara:strand:+ start:408 stop:857 length:450 start_codon:yes stop_codon:yes gene_type:complete